MNSQAPFYIFSSIPFHFTLHKSQTRTKCKRLVVGVTRVQNGFLHFQLFALFCSLAHTLFQQMYMRLRNINLFMMPYMPTGLPRKKFKYLNLTRVTVDPVFNLTVKIFWGIFLQGNKKGISNRIYPGGKS